MASSATTHGNGIGWRGSGGVRLWSQKVKRMVDVSVALFARFAGNAQTSDLLSMLA